MHQTTRGRFRVLPGRTDDEWLFLDVESADPTYVSSDGEAEIAAGNLVEATLSWDEETPSVDSSTVIEGTRFRFVRTDEPAFEVARECFAEAREANEGMNSCITRATDNEPNGVVYTFAEQAGQRDLFSEFRDGIKPLEPLVARAADAAEPPFSVWVLDTPQPFVLVYIVLGPDSLLEETMCETYL